MGGPRAVSSFHLLQAFYGIQRFVIVNNVMMNPTEQDEVVVTMPLFVRLSGIVSLASRAFRLYVTDLANDGCPRDDWLRAVGKGANISGLPKKAFHRLCGGAIRSRVLVRLGHGKSLKILEARAYRKHIPQVSQDTPFNVESRKIFQL